MINEIFVHHVTSLTGEPGKTLWTVQDKILFDPPRFAALVTGKTNEYAIVLRPDGEGEYKEGLAVVKLKPGGDEELVAKLPPNLFADGPPWAYDPVDEMLYVLLKTNL